MPNTVKETLYSLIRENKLDTACTFVNQNIRTYQNEEYFVLFYILLNIRTEELEAGANDIFSSPVGREPEDLLTHYTQIKLYLRRFEYQMADDILQEAVDYFTQTAVSPQAIYRIAQFACVNPEAALKKLNEFYTK